MEEYRTFLIDSDLCDHSLLVTSKEYGIKKTFITINSAKAYIDGFMDALEILSTVETV